MALLKGMDDRSARRRRVGELREVVALTEHADRRLRGFSGVVWQRVGIAQALLADPQLLIVDEPTAGLDPEERIRLRTLLSQFAGRRTVLLSTHIVDDIAQTCREVALLAKGRLIFRGTVDELTRRAEGRVWSVVTDGPPPAEGTVVSALPHEDGMRYRIVASAAPSAQARPMDPGLEDSYLASPRDEPGE